MPKREDIIIEFGGDDSGFRKAAKRVQRTGAELAASFRRIGASIASAFGVGVGVAGGGLAAGIANLTNDLDELGKTAKGLNTTVEELYSLRYAVEQTSNATDRQLDTALQKLVKHVGQANRGIKESQKLFTELGLSWEYLATLRSDQVFLEVNAAIAAQEDAFKRASLAQKVYEDNWRVLMPTILTSNEAMAEHVRRVKEMGAPTDEAAEAAARLNDSISDLNKQMQGLSYEYGPGVIDFLNQFIARIRGAETIETLKSDISGVAQELAILEGRGEGVLQTLAGIARWFRDTADGGERTKERIAELRKEYDRLKKTIIDLESAAKGKQGETTVLEAVAGTGDPVKAKKAAESAASKVKGVGGTTAKPELSYQQANLRDYQAYKSGEIDRAEYLKRERTRNPYSNPESPYAEDFAVKPSAGSPYSGINLDRAGTQLVVDIRKQIQQELNSGAFNIKVKPELVGMEGVEIATRDTADKEGGHE